MADSTVNLSSADVEHTSASPSQQVPSLSSNDVELSSSDVEVQGQSQGPANPYATDMSKVAGAVPGMQSPMQAAGIRKDRVPMVENHGLPIDLPQADVRRALEADAKPSQPTTPEQTDADVLDAESKMFGMKPGDFTDNAMRQGVAQVRAQQKAHPVESLIQDADPVLGSWATGAYEAGAGLKDLGQSAVDLDKKEALKGATRTIGGAMTAGAPEFGLAAWQAPVKTAAYYFAGVKAGEGAKAVAAKLGMSPEAQEFANVVGFFIPAAFHTVTQLSAETGTRTARVPDPAAEGGVREVPVKTAAVGGRGFGFGVGKGEDGSIYAAGRVGPFSARAKFGGTAEGAPEAPRQPGNIAGQLPAAGVDPTANLGRPAPPDAATVQSQQQADAITGAAARAAASASLAESMTGQAPPPPPPPKPGEPGSKQVPLPAGMEDGELSTQSVDHVGKAIQAMPPKLKAPAILEAVTNLAKWIRAKGTIVGPDGKLSQITGQSPASQDQSAHTLAVKLVNDEMDRQAEKADAVKEQAQTVEQEHAAAIQGSEGDADGSKPTTSAAKPAEGQEQVSIPDNRVTRNARGMLRNTPHEWTSEQMDRMLRDNVMLTTPVRDALVQAEVARRANAKEEVAESVMTGKVPAPGQSREELQRWADAVGKGEHPFVHIPQDSSFRPNGVGGLMRTSVKGAGAFSGTYYHSADVDAADIRKAARDKTDPQAALDKIVADFKGNQPPVELKGEDVEHAPALENPAQSIPDSIPAAEPQTAEVAESPDSQFKWKKASIVPTRGGGVQAVPHPEEPEPVDLKPEVTEALGQIVEEHAADNPSATLDTVLSDPKEGKIIAEALINDGIITNSAMNPSTAILTTKTRKALTTSVLGEVFGNELMQQTPDFVREKLSGILGTWGIIHGKDDAWSLQKPMLAAIDLFNRAYRSENVDTSNPVSNVIMQHLDAPVDALRRAVSMYAITAEMARDNVTFDGEVDKPYLGFNTAFGTELTESQYDEAIKGREKPQDAAIEPQGEVLPPEPKSLAVGDEVTYKTNKGKERTGTVAWTDGKRVRIKDGGSEVTKKVEEVGRKGGENASPLSGRDAVLPNGKPIPATTEGMSGQQFKDLLDQLVKVPDLGAAADAMQDTVEGEKPEVEKDVTLVDALQLAFDNGKGPKNYNDLKKLVREFDEGKEPDQLRMKAGQEAYEAMLNRVAAELISLPTPSNKEKFDALVRLYENQPNLAIRTSTSVQNQAYSTPIPLAFVAGRFAGIEFRRTSVYEPTAGNGALVIAADPTKVHANELDQSRAATLQAEGFHVTRNDASTWAPTGRFDAVVTNPPFGKLAGPVKIDGYNVVKLEHLIAAKALGAMKDDGKAVIIIAAGDREKPGQVTNDQRPWFNWLYSHYNVVSDFELNGDLYARQGASYPVRVLAVDGRVASARVSPMPEEIKRLNTWGEVYEHAAQHLGSDLEGQRRADDEPGRIERPESTVTGAVPAISAGGAGRTDISQPEAGAKGHGGSGGSASGPRPVQHTGAVPDPGVGSADITVRSDGDVAQSDRLAEGQPTPKAVRRKPAELDGHSANDLADDSNQFQSTYRPSSDKKDTMVVAPKALIGPMQDAMARVSDDVGDIDQWLADELGYSDVDTLHEAFMGLQVDSVAAAIHNMARGKAVVIADQTGIGKGRQAAAMIRWAEMHGHIPVFVTAKAQLFSDMYGDLRDIGSGDTIKPLLFNADATITHPVTGRKIFANTGAMRPVYERMMETGELPAGRNALFLTYSQINQENRQQLALKRIAARAIFILDESHNAAGGESNTGQYLQETLAASRGVAFFSATWAKRPDNLPLYAAKTDLSIAVPDRDLLPAAIAAGGAPLQAVMTSQLAQSGQFFRRERSFDGISIDDFVAEGHRAEHEKICDRVTEVLRAIVKADAVFHHFDFEKIVQAAKKSGKSAGSKGLSVSHQEFSSLVHNLVRQLLLALKADISANELIKSIENGEKPIFALQNTMGSFLSEYVNDRGLRDGALLSDLNYSSLLHRSLARTRYYNETNAMGEKRRITVAIEELEASRPFYDEAQRLIDDLDVDLPVSPIDHIRMRLEKAGYKVAEITGRELAIDYSGNVAKLTKVPDVERNDRVATASGFNNGKIDALILNEAGSTGISLHASEKFTDQRPRHMMIGQPAGDINIVMQMLGRINRTGQVKLPRYKMIAVALPAEMRPQINLAKKMKSLNANVSSNTRSATSVQAVDLMNKYGDDVVARYLADNPEMAKMLDLDVSESDGKLTYDEGLASKATGHSALLAVKDQKAFMDAISEAYTNYIDFLDETGQNDLEPRTYDYDAKEQTSKRVYQGTDPSSPFGQDAFYGEYSIKRQGKSFTPEEVKAKIAESFGPEAMKLAPHQRDTLAARELAAHMEELYKPYFASLTTDHARERATLIRDLGRSILNEYRVGSGLRIEINGDTMTAVVTRIDGAKKPAGNPYAPSALQFTLAVNDAMRQVRVPGSQLRSISVADLGRNADVDRLFADYHGDSRQRVKIITGNLLGAFGSLKGKTKGRIISFSMSDGSTRQGILMPSKFDVDADISQDYAMRTAEGALEFLRTGGSRMYVQSRDGEVGISSSGDGLEIRTKASKAAGGRFYLDPRLRELVVGNDFASSGGMMKAHVKQGAELDALRNVMLKIALYPTPSEMNRAREIEEKMQTKPEKPEPPTTPAGRRLKGSDPTATMSFMGTGYAAKGAQDVLEFGKKAVPATIDDLMKAAKLTTRTMKQAGREVVAALYPRALADEDAKDIMGRGIGHPALTMFRAGQLMDGIGKMFQGMPDKDQVEFVDRWQAGKKQPTQDLQDAQELMQSVLEGQRLEEVAAVNLGRKEKDAIDLSNRENYFPNRYKTPPNGEKPLTDDEQMARMHAPSRRPFEGSKTFLKQQKMTLKEAVDQGAEPLGTPVEMVMRRMQEGAKFVAAKYVIHSYKEAGIIQFLRQGKKMPAGYVRIEDRFAKVLRPVETAEGGVVFQHTGEWIIQEDAGRLLNNYLSKDNIRGTAIGQSLMKLKTATTEIRLSFSPFHWGTITFENWASGINVGIDKLYNQGLRNLDGNAALDGLADMGKAMVAPYTAVKLGGQMIQYARTPDEFLESPEGKKFVAMYPDYPHLQELLFAGGLRWGMPDTYKASLGDGFTKEIAAGHLGKATLKFFPWLSHMMMKPLFEHYIPRAKWTFAVQMLSAKLDQYAYAIAAGEITEEQIARDVASATENRFGEFNFDNLYWNNTLRTANQLMFRSVSWKAGTWLSAAKSVKETFSSQAFNDHAYERIEQDAKGWEKVRNFTRKLPQLGVNTGRLISMFMVASVLGSVMARLSTGKWPWEWAQEDVDKLRLPYLGAMAFEMMHPRTGHADPHGAPVRMTFPTDVKDYEHAAMNPRGYVRGSLADVTGTALDSFENRDAFGNYVFDPNAPVWKEFQEGMMYNLKGSFLPMSLSNYRDQFGPQDVPSKIERATGVIGGSPRELDRSHALNEALAMRPAHAPLTPDQQQEEQDKKAHPTPLMVRRAAREKNLDYLQRVVLHDLSYTQAKQIYEDPKTTDAERRELGPIIARKRESMIRAATRR